MIKQNSRSFVVALIGISSARSVLWKIISFELFVSLKAGQTGLVFVNLRRNDMKLYFLFCRIGFRGRRERHKTKYKMRHETLYKRMAKGNGERPEPESTGHLIYLIKNLIMSDMRRGMGNYRHDINFDCLKEENLVSGFQNLWENIKVFNSFSMLSFIACRLPSESRKWNLIR